MTRDEVLEEAARALDEPAAARWAGRVRALKSTPPEKSPEVEVAECSRYEKLLDALWDGTSGMECDRCQRITANGTCTECRHGVSPLAKAESERDALRLQVGELKLALQGAQAEVAQLRWEARGSPMPGETPRSE